MSINDLPPLDDLVNELNATGLPRSEDDVRLRHWLETLRAEGGSDLYLVAGIPPAIRVNGVIKHLPEAPLDGDDIENVVLPELPPHAAASYRARGHADSAIRLGAGMRFRVNLHHERGRVAASVRALPARPPQLGELGLPPSVEALTRLSNGSGAA